MRRMEEARSSKRWGIGAHIHTYLQYVRVRVLYVLEGWRLLAVCVVRQRGEFDQIEDTRVGRGGHSDQIRQGTSRTSLSHTSPVFK